MCTQTYIYIIIIIGQSAKGAKESPADMRHAVLWNGHFVYRATCITASFVHMRGMHASVKAAASARDTHTDTPAALKYVTHMSKNGIFN